MKFLSRFLVALSLFVPGSASADSDAAREFKRLGDDRTKAVAAALEPINRRYRASLEQLLKRATQAGDLETAVKVKEAIDALDQPTPVSKRATNAVASAIAGEWVWGDPKFWIVVNADGKASMSGKQHEWEALSDGTVIMRDPDGKEATLRFDSAFKTFMGTNFDGKPFKGYRRK